MSPDQTQSPLAVPPLKPGVACSTASLKPTSRVNVVDALRGFAIMSIMLLHNLEHFDFYFFPKDFPSWLKALDGKIWDTMFFLFSGKSYAIFALLFGFTFFIMFDKQQKQGRDFRGRFLWRLLLLLGFGTINSIFYEGDILALYAVLGVSLVLVCKWNDIAVLITAAILMLQPMELWKVAMILNNPAYQPPPELSGHYFGLSSAYLSGSSFWDMAIGNLWNGRVACTLWSYENGRFFQACALFMMGMLLGRRGLFLSSDANKAFWKRSLAVALVSFVVLFSIKSSLSNLIPGEVLRHQIAAVVSTWTNFTMMTVWVSGFVLLFQVGRSHALLAKLEPFGRMSLTNYVTQSILGSIIYYGYGLGLYKHTGATYCLLIGVTLFLLQLTFCNWWLRRHKQGPLEAIWHRFTWMGRKNATGTVAVP